MEFDIKLISKEINERMWTAHKTLATAESCTAGRVSSVITAIPGSSNYFRGGLVCYQNDIKEDMLGVSPDTIAEHTVVSEAVAREMVVGATKLFKSDYAVAITGYAGPGGADAVGSSVIVGNIWVAVGSPERIETRLITEDNGREKNLSHATAVAIHMLRDFIAQECPEKVEE
ncbi:MAG: CinA family protein [Bacteroidaceae bacterium]|nr:CinA family protein [Bacteroidaceae bacterium]